MTLSMCRARTGLDGPCGSFQLRIFHDFEITCRQSWTESSLCQTQQIPLQAGAVEHKQDTGGATAASSASRALSLPVSALSLTPTAALGQWELPLALLQALHGHGSPRGHWGQRRARCVLQQALTEVQRAGLGSLRFHKGHTVHREPEPCPLSAQLLIFHTHLLQKEAFAWCCWICNSQ